MRSQKNFQWTPALPKHYQKNVIIRDLYCVKNRSSNFVQESTNIYLSILCIDKYIKTGYPVRFINSVIHGFIEEQEDLLIPTSLFQERK